MRILAAAFLVATTAEAAPSFDVRVAADGTQLARQPVAPTSSAVHAASRVIYLNKNGGVLHPGNNNSRTDTSSIVSSLVNLPGWNTDAATWAATVDCMQEIWAPFGVEITDVDPGQVMHIEARFGGTPGALGLPSNVAGIAPMALDCSVVENSIVFTFPSKLGNNARLSCEVMSQEIGHSYGLDHELEASDPMTYLAYSGERSFQDRSVACGESTARPCGIGGNVCRANQNSFGILLDRLGAADSDRVSPAVQLVSPKANAVVEPGFVVNATATDNVGVTSISLFVDGDLVASHAAPAEFTTDPSLSTGDHTLVVEAVDAAGNTSMAEIEIRIAGAEGGGGDGDGDGDDDGGPNPPGFMPVGCASTGGAGALPIGLALLLLVRRRRRG